MTKRMILPLLFGLVGCAILISLGTWQVKRLAWKEGILAEIEARLAADPTPVPLAGREAEDEYKRVTLAGTPTGEELHVLASGTGAGTGYRVVSKFLLGNGQPILVDLGLLPLDAKDAAPSTEFMQLTGTLLWPDDQNSSTPEPDIDGNIWFARNVDTMSALMDTRPLLVVASTATPADPRLTPLPIATANIRNDHMQYAITWFLLAAAWAGMTGYLLWRIRQRTV
jgi:surfeit locus 1 family protein